MVVDRILFDFGVILGSVYINFWKSRTFTFRFFVRACFPVIFLSTSESTFRRLGLPNRGFRMDGIAKKRLFMEIVFCRFLRALGTVFLIFLALKRSLKTKGFFVM